MKRTTIMVDEDLLNDLQQLARYQQRSTSSVIREALAAYVIDERGRMPEDPGLLALAGIGESEQMVDLADGEDERQLRQDVHPLAGWGKSDDSHT